MPILHACSTQRGLQITLLNIFKTEKIDSHTILKAWKNWRSNSVYIFLEYPDVKRIE